MTTATTPTFLLRGGEQWRDPWDDYRALRDHDPCHKVEHPSLGEFWVLSRFDDVFAAARDTATFSSAKGLTPGPDGSSMFDDDSRPIVMMDPPDHTAIRRLVSKPMTPRRVAPFEAGIQEYVAERLDAIEEQARSGADVDIVEMFFKPLPSFVVAHYLGVPVADRSKFDVWTNAIVAANAADDHAQAMDAFTELFAYADELMTARRAEPGDDLVSLLANDDSVSAGWIVGFVFTMVTGGNDTTTGLLSGAAELLTKHPDQQRTLASDPDLVAPAVEEFLRLTSPVQNLARTTTAAVERHGRTIPADTKVLLLYGSANRDEREFGPTAPELDIHRPIDKMLSLGYGAHHCLGAAAARLQATVALTGLLRRFPTFAVDHAAGQFAPGAYVRRYEHLPFHASS